MGFVNDATHREFASDEVQQELAPNWIPVVEQPAFHPRKLRVVCVGAGYSGLMIAHKYRYEMSMSDYVDLTIYEKNRMSYATSQADY